MDRRLINYLPSVLREVLEFRAINDANEPEIAAVWDALNRLVDNQFLDTADSAGVAVWERELGIRPKDTDTLEIRKVRVKNLWNLGGPYTYKWLLNWLKSLGGEASYVSAVDDYTVRVVVPISVDYINILDDMRQRVSANMMIDPLISLSKIDVKHGIGTAFRCSICSTIQMSAWDMSHIDPLTEENGSCLTDELGEVLYEEVIL